jgi:hypothetical protein
LFPHPLHLLPNPLGPTRGSQGKAEICQEKFMLQLVADKMIGWYGLIRIKTATDGGTFLFDGTFDGIFLNRLTRT